MAKWMDLQIKLPIQKVDPSAVRRRLAAASDGAPDQLKLSPAIFHYSPDGRPLSKMSGIRFGGGREFHVFAAGNEAVGLLGAEGHKIVSLLEKSYCGDAIEKRTTGVYDVRPAGKLLDYRIPMMVLQQSPAQYRAIMEADEKGKVTYAENKIRCDLDRQFAALGLAVEMDDPDVLMGDVKIDGDIHPIEVKDGVWFLAAREVSFRTNLDMKGVFHAGHLISRGYGLIFHGRRGC